MGAVPKNKITRAERGKRRHGNRPLLLKDFNSSVPFHKRGFVTELLKFVGLDNSVPDTALVASDKNSAKATKEKSASPTVSSLADRKSQKNTALASKAGAKIASQRTTNK